MAIVKIAVTIILLALLVEGFYLSDQLLSFPADVAVIVGAITATCNTIIVFWALKRLWFQRSVS